MKKDSLGDRMKSYYEDRSKTYLPRRSNVIIRIDGCHFHTFTKGFEKPFDKIFIEAMQRTTKHLCENIQGCKLGYVQSDEISLLLTDYDKLETDAWFDNSVQKMCSVAASMATLYFNKEFNSLAETYCLDTLRLASPDTLCEAYKKAEDEGAYFDARCFVLPKEEVCNYFIWRQQDAVRNSISGLAQVHFSQKALNGKGREAMKTLLKEIDINWDDLNIEKKCGACVIKLNNTWKIDTNIPIFVENRKYIENCLPLLD